MSTVLLVDDNPQNLYLLQVLLSANGFQVEGAANGAEALERARRDPPDMVISDILMPVMDGFTLCRAWKEDERLQHIPFVFYTATYTDPKDEDFARSLGADRFLIKPLEPDKFLTLILETLKNCQAGQPVAPRQPVEEAEYYKEYNATLIRKLEDKMLQLEKANRILEGDIAERQRAEGALRESEAKTRSIVDNIGIGVALISPEMEVLELNHRMREWFPAVEPGQRPICYGAFNDPPRERLCDYCPTHKTLQDGLVHEATTQTPQAGRVRSYRIVSSPILNASGEVTAAIEMVEDITEKLSLESQFLQSQKMEAVGRLAGGVAHDFNNMLNVILGYAEMALDKVDPAQPLHDDLKEILNAARRSAGIIRQLLAFARKQTIDPKVLDLNETVEGMLKMLRRLIGEDIDLVWRPDSGLWPVKMDPTQVEQILANLCANARDAIAQVGKITIETENTAFDEAYCADHPGFVPGEYALLAISDDGHGMDQETQDKIFEPFFTTKALGQGTGLGLATVYGIVKQNNGFINVYSEPGKGTTFKIYLARQAVQDVEPQQESEAEIPRSRGETVLVVEDEVSLLKLASEILDKLGYTVLTAVTPGEALRLVEEYPGEIHLLMTDVILPEMNGSDLAVQIQEIRPAMKYLFMSGYTAEVIAHRGMLDEGVQFIPKPFSVRDLAAKVRTALKEEP